MKVKDELRYAIFLLLGIFMLVTVSWAYGADILQMREFELTFLSNTLMGVLLITGGCWGIIGKKKLPQILYLNATVVLLLVFLICMAFWKTMNFSDGFQFLHIVNPLAALAVCLLLTEQEKSAKLYTAIIFPFCYMVYAIIYGYASGNWLYGFINIPDKGLLYVLCVIVISGAAVLALAWAVCALNCAIKKRGI